MKIALSPGHTPTSSGASRGVITEYGLSSAIIGDLTFRLDKLDHDPYLIGADSNRNQVEDINNINPDFGLELHFNASKGKGVHGTEVLHAGSKQGELLAGFIQNSLVSSLGTFDRGIVVGNYQLNKRKSIIEIIKNTNCPFVVVEPLFLSNNKDFEKIDIPLISISILNGIIKYIDNLKTIPNWS